jgi:hypothetical protein
MWELRLIKSLTYYSWPSIDIRLIENSIFKVFMKCSHIYIYMAFRVGWGPHICDWPGIHHTFLRLCIQHVPKRRIKIPIDEMTKFY